MDSLVSILRTNQNSIDLANEVEVLNALVQVQESWASLKLSLSEFHLMSIFEFMENLAHSDELFNAITTLGADAARLKEQANKISDYLGRIPEDYRKLLQPISDFDEESPGSNPGLVDWEIFDLGKVGIVSSDYAFDIGSSSRLSLEAGDTWPHPHEDMPDPLLRISFSGHLKAEGRALIPLKFGSVNMGTSNVAALNINYYFDTANSNSLYAASVAMYLEQLGNPFTLNGCWSKLVGTDLVGVTAQVAGSSSIEVKVGLVEGFTVAQDTATAKLDLTFGVKVGLDGDYELRLRNTSRAAGDSIEVQVVRKRQSSRGIAIGSGLQVDMAGLAARVRHILREHLGSYQTVLEEYQDFLTPGTYIREQAKVKLETAIKNITRDTAILDAINEVIQAAFGLDEKPDLTAVEAVLTDEIVNALDSAGEVLSSNARSVASVVARSISSGLSLNGTELEAKLGDELIGLIEAITDGLKTRIGKLTDAKIEKLVKMLEKSGASVSTGVNTANNALSGVSEIIAKYERLLNKLITTTQQSARSRVTAKLEREWSASTGSIVEACLEISMLTPATEKAFQTIVSGDFSGLVSLLDTITPGLTFDRERTALTRFSTHQDRVGFEVVLFGIEFGSQSIFDAETKVIGDATGRISVISKGSWERRISTPREEREVKFVDAFELAAAKTTRELSFNLTISHQDERLKRREVISFLRSFENAGLVPRGTVARATDIFDAWMTANDDEIIEADINLALALDYKASLRVLRLSERFQNDLTDSARMNIFRLAFRELAESGAVDVERVAEWADAARKQARMEDSKPRIEVLYDYTPRLHERLMNDPNLSPTFNSRRIRELEKAAELHELCMGFVYFVDTMGDIYSATPAFDSADGWTRQDYMEAQKQLNRHIRKWLKIKTKWLFWIAEEAHPRTVAFVGALLALAEVRSESGQPTHLSVTMVRRDGIGGIVVLN